MEKSYHKALDKNLDDLKEEDYEVLETLCNRFGRTVDILINKIPRGLDLIELEDISRKLDIVIRAEKRGFVDDYKVLVALKDLRKELEDFAQFLWEKKFKQGFKRKKLSLTWVGGLKEYRDKFTSLDLQKKALEWWDFDRYT